MHGHRAALSRLVSLSAHIGLALMLALGHSGSAQAKEIVFPVPRMTIYPGEIITEAMVVEKEFRASDYEGPGYIPGIEGLVGKVARSTLLPDRPVAINGVREPFIIQQGQPAVVIFQSGGLVISSTAVPLQAGAVGDMIALRNVDSGTTIRGVVSADGTVRVGMP